MTLTFQDSIIFLWHVLCFGGRRTFRFYHSHRRKIILLFSSLWVRWDFWFEILWLLTKWHVSNMILESWKSWERIVIESVIFHRVRFLHLRPPDLSMKLCLFFFYHSHVTYWALIRLIFIVPLAIFFAELRDTYRALNDSYWSCYTLFTLAIIFCSYPSFSVYYISYYEIIHISHCFKPVLFSIRIFCRDLMSEFF